MASEKGGGGWRRRPSSPPLKSTPAFKYIQQKELAPFYNTTELIKIVCNVTKHIFLLSRHVTQYLVHWANNETAIEIFSNAQQKKWRYIVYRLKQKIIVN